MVSSVCLFLTKFNLGDRYVEAPEDADETSSSTSSSGEPPAHVAAFRELVAGLEGEFHTDYAHYAKLGACLVTLLATAVYCVAAPGTGFWTHMLGAVLLGMFWQQTMFIGHDAGHGAITHDHQKDFYIGLVVGNLCNGEAVPKSQKLFLYARRLLERRLVFFQTVDSLKGW